jgi:NAD(P)-dependent dehydrogenase (short-subunit alcohol dehydrogenase family)
MSVLVWGLVPHLEQIQTSQMVNMPKLTPSPKPAVLVTGAAKRVGAEICRFLAQAGWHVIIHHHNSAEAADELAVEIGGASVLSADLADAKTAEQLVDEAFACAPRLEAIVNNAAIFRQDEWHNFSAKLWQEHMAVNALAPTAIACRFAQRLPRVSTGAVVNIIDQRVWRLNPDFLSYTASKATLWSTTQMLAQALAPRVRVNAVGPGPTLQSIHQDSHVFEAEAQMTPLQHAVSPLEIAHAVAYLLNAKSVTGQMIAVDSGQHLAWETPDVMAQHRR